MPISFTCRVIHWPRTWKLSIAGTWTVGVMPAIVVAGDLADLLLVPLRVGQAAQAVALEHDVRQDAVQPLVHLAA